MYEEAQDRSLDISSKENDFIYQLVSYYLQEVSDNPPSDLITSINNLVDTIMSYYLLAKRNGIIDIEKSRKVLETKMEFHVEEKYDLLEESKRLNEEFEKLEKRLTGKVGTKDIDYLLSTHEDFISDISKKSDSKNECITPLEDNRLDNHAEVAINKRIDELENKLRDDLNKMIKNLAKVNSIAAPGMVSDIGLLSDLTEKEYVGNFQKPKLIENFDTMEDDLDSEHTLYNVKSDKILDTILSESQYSRADDNKENNPYASILLKSIAAFTVFQLVQYLLGRLANYLFDN